MKNSEVINVKKLLNKIRNINNTIAIKVTNFVGSMLCAYIFCVLAIYGLTGVDMHNTFQIVQWISQTFLQLVLLSVIMLGQNLNSANSEKRAQEDHERILEELEEIKQMHLEQQNMMIVLQQNTTIK